MTNREKKGDYAAAAMSVALWGWINFFHDVGARAFYPFMKDVYVGSLFIGSCFNCFALSLGLAAASLLVFAGCRRGILVGPRGQRALYLTGVILTVLFYVLRDATMRYALTSLVSLGAVTVGGMLLFTSVLPRSKNWRRLLPPTAVSAVILVKVLEALSQTVLPFSLVSAVAMHLALLAVCAFLAFREPVETSAAGADRARSASRRSPYPLLWSVLCYGLSFGVMHGMLGFSPESRTMNYGATLLISIPVAAAVVFGCIWRLRSTEGIWDRLRGAVFPATMLGYSLFVTLVDIPLSTVIISGAYCAYVALLVEGCIVMAEECSLDLIVASSAALLLLFSGYTAGAAAGYVFGLLGLHQSQLAVSLLLVGMFLVLSLGTFWIGNERSRRKWWGLRIEETPEYRHEEALRDICEHIATRYELSPREEDILFRVACGKKAEQIRSDYSLSIYTVRNHIQRVYRKLNVHSALELQDFVKEYDIHC